jgi:hypothetical protein
VSIQRYAKGAALVGLAAAVSAFAGVPVKEPTKEPPKTTEKAAEKPAEKSSEKKCPYSTQECLNYMAARLKASGWIGIEYDPEKANEISRVVAGSPA